MADVATQQAAESAGGEKKKRRKGGGVWRVVFWVSLVVFIGAISALGYIAWGYYSSDKGYKDVATQALVAADTKAAEVMQEQAEPEEAGLTLADLEVDWDYLRSVNPDVVAWVYMPGTRINYPVVHGVDNDQYLWTDFNRTSSRNGSIFVDSENSGKFDDANNVLYGHHMNDGSMFACVSNVLPDPGEFNAHRTIYVLTPTLNYKCRTFSIIKTNGWELLVQTSFADDKEKTEYIQDKMNRSVVQPDDGMPNVADITRLFTFSTCDYGQDNGRAVMFAQAVDTAVPKSAPQDQGSSSSQSSSQGTASSDAAEEQAPVEVSEEDQAALGEGVARAEE
ncbi:MAG: class B sortase [Eggerthellaceae bacterium]|nr:class B sortase [Eggerthellaceae bacterium]